MGMPAFDPGSIPDASSAAAMRAARMAIGTLFFVLGFAFATWVSRMPEVQAALALSPAALGARSPGSGRGRWWRCRSPAG